MSQRFLGLGRRLKFIMKKSDGEKFYSELEKRLHENRRLYRGFGFGVLDSGWMRFVASYLGVNPWKVFIPVAMTGALIGRLVFGRAFTEYVLRLLGGS